MSLVGPSRHSSCTAEFGRFSNRPVGVKHFQAIHCFSVNVAHGLVLLFGISTKAVPSWDPRTRRNNLSGGLAVSQTAGPSDQANSPHPSSREGHLSTAGWNSIFLLSDLIGCLFNRTGPRLGQAYPCLINRRSVVLRAPRGANFGSAAAERTAQRIVLFMPLFASQLTDARDGGPCIVVEFVARGSRLQFRSLDHVQGRIINPRRPVAEPLTGAQRTWPDFLLARPGRG